MPFLTTREELASALNVPDINVPLLKDRTKIERRFSHWQVETLLNQALDLLERNQRERTIYDGLRARWLELCTDVYADGQEILYQTRYKNDGHHKAQHHFDAAEFNSRQRYTSMDPVEHTIGWNEILRCYNVAQTTSEEKNDAVGVHVNAAQQYIIHKDLRRLNEMMDAIARKSHASAADAIGYEHRLTYLMDNYENRVQAMNEVGGALNFREQFTALQTQMQADYDDAVVRLEAAHLGMIDFFGYGRNESEAKLPERRTLEALVTWTRNAIAWMIAFSHGDQIASTCLSLRTILGDQWPELIDKLRANQPFESIFKWDGGAFKDASLVRVTGIGSYYIGATRSIILQARLQMPRHAVSNHNGTQHKLEQDLPVSLLGRIGHIDSTRPIEIIGTSSLRNASPIGDSSTAGLWKVSISPAFPISDEEIAIDDVLFELQTNVHGSF